MADASACHQGAVLPLLRAARFIELQPEDSSGYSNRGYAFRKLAEYTAAVEDYSAAIQLGGSTSTRLHNNRCFSSTAALPVAD